MDCFPARVLVVSDAPQGGSGARAVAAVCDEVRRLGADCIFYADWHDALAELRQTLDIGAVLIDWDAAYARCKEPMRKYLVSKHAQLSGHRVLTLPALDRDPFYGARHPLMALEKAGYNLLVPRDYPDAAVRRLAAAGTYDALLALVDAEGLRVVASPLHLIRSFKAVNRRVRVFLYTERLVLERLPLAVLESIEAYVWKGEETASFVAKRIVTASREYVTGILPPFFRALVEYVGRGKYSWHCPGHMGGVGYLRSPPGKYFFDFFGENMLSADLCNAVGELGSLLAHTGPIGDAERYASKVFGSDHTYFVTNGTSTANKMVFQATAGAGDVVVLDRNSHKSSMQAIQQGNIKPVYVAPVRNKYGIIGPIPLREFRAERLIGRSAGVPYLGAGDLERPVKLVVLTQCTYDGICYNVGRVSQLFSDLEAENILFDEAWFPYAHFHPFYRAHHSMNTRVASDDDPIFNGNAYVEGDDDAVARAPTPHGPVGTVFATQSTHKVLTALSQGSMVHIRNAADPHIHDRFNTFFQANTTTSPLYAIIASLDMASAIMDTSGEAIVDDVLREAVSFRCAMVRVRGEVRESARGWWFGVWQPRDILAAGPAAYDPAFWVLPASGPDAWHGFPEVGKGQYLLDPLKVNIVTVDEDEGVEIPASIVGKFLAMNGIIMEKLGFYTMLSLFTVGSRRGKSATLVTALMQFKRLYDNNTPLRDVFQTVPDAHHAGVGLRDFCEMMNPEVKEMQAMENRVFTGELPEIAVLPYVASGKLVHNEVDWVPVDALTGRVSALLLVPYPPGIPMVMPGEVFSALHTQLICAYARFEERWKGFGLEIHGLVQHHGQFVIPCLRRDAVPQ